MRSSDGWPLSGPICSVRREPLTSEPKTNVRARSDEPGGGPGVLVEAQPAVGPEGHGDRGRDRQGDAQPEELEVAEPQGPRARSPGRRGPAAGVPSGAGRCRRGTPPPGEAPRRAVAPRRRARRARRGARRRRGGGPAGSAGSRRPVRKSPSDRLPIARAATTAASRPSSRGRARGRGKPGRAGGAGVGREPRHPRPRSRRSRTSPIRISSPYASAVTPGDRGAVHVRPVRAAKILDVPRPAAEGQHGMLRRRVRVVHDDAAAEVAAERRHRVEGEDGARAPAAPTRRRRRAGRATLRDRGRPLARRGGEPAPSAPGRPRAGRGTRRRSAHRATLSPASITTAAACRPRRSRAASRRSRSGRPDRRRPRAPAPR